MKTLLSGIICISLYLAGCSNFNPQLASTAVATGVAAGLRFGIKDPAQRAEVANYIYVAAGALRTIVGTPTPEVLTTQITAFIPANIKSDYPELIALVVPLIVTIYQTALAKYGENAPKVYETLNALASSLELGAASYRTTGQLAVNMYGYQYGIIQIKG